jgi:hypothetical protein
MSLTLLFAVLIAHACATATFSAYNASGLPHPGSVVGFWGFDDPANPLADTSGNANHMIDDLSRNVTLVNLTGGHGRGLALATRRANPNRIRTPAGLAAYSPATLCVTVRLLKSKKAEMTEAFISNPETNAQFGLVGITPWVPPGAPVYLESVLLMGVYIGTVTHAAVSAGTGIDGGTYNNGMILHLVPDTGRFDQWCFRWRNQTENGLIETQAFRNGYLQADNKALTTSEGGNYTYGPSPFTNSSKIFLGYGLSRDANETQMTFSSPYSVHFDEVILWSRYLTNSEIATYYNISNSPSFGLRLGANGSTAVPIAKFSFSGPTPFVNQVPSSYLGDLVPAGYNTQETSAILWPVTPAYNYTAAPVAVTNASGIHGDAILCAADTLYITSGGFGRNTASLCFDFKDQGGEFLNLPCLESDQQRVPTSAVGNAVGFCVWSDAQGDLFLQYDCCNFDFYISAYNPDEWNRACYTFDNSVPNTIDFRGYFNGVLVINTSRTAPNGGIPFLENTGFQLSLATVYLDEIVVYDGIMSQSDVDADYNGFLTESPTGVPTVAPTTVAPTAAPSASGPTAAPSSAPTDAPTSAPTGAPTSVPTSVPTSAPTRAPTTATPTNVPTSVPTHAPTTASPTNAPTSMPTHAPTTASPTNAPTTAAPTTASPTEEPTTSGPTSEPTGSLSTQVPIALQVRANVTSTAVLASGLALGVRLANASGSVPFNLTVVGIESTDLPVPRLASAGPITQCTLPVGTIPITGATINSGAVSFQPIAVSFDLSSVLRFEALGRKVLSCSPNTGGTWLDPLERCAALNATPASTAAFVDYLHLSTSLCEPAHLIVADVPTRERWCAAGLYGCDCASSSDTRSDTASHLYISGIAFLMFGHVFINCGIEEEHRETMFQFGSPWAALGLILLLAAAAVDDPGASDPDSVPASLPNWALHTIGIALATAGLLGSFAFVYWKQIWGHLASWFCPKSFVHVSGDKRIWPLGPHWGLAALYVLVAVQLGFPIWLSGPRSSGAWTGPALVAAPLFVAVLFDGTDDWRVRALVVMLIISGLGICAWALSQQPCGQRYGSDQPTPRIY